MALLAKLRATCEQLTSDVGRVSTDLNAARREVGEASTRHSASEAARVEIQQERDELAVDLENAESARDAAVAMAEAATVAAESAVAAADEVQRNGDSLAQQLEAARCELATAAQQAADRAATDAHVHAVATQHSISGAQ